MASTPHPFALVMLGDFRVAISQRIHTRTWKERTWSWRRYKGMVRRACSHPCLKLGSSTSRIRKVFDAPHWWCCTHCDGLSRLSLSLDYHFAAPGLVAGWNGSGQFSRAQYRLGVHRGGRLFRGGACAGVLVLVWPETSDLLQHPRSLLRV